MSYDLDFWKLKKDTYLKNQEVYKKCSEEEIVDGLEDLPIDSILNDIQIEITDWKMKESNIDYENPNAYAEIEKGILKTTIYLSY
jgi:hypothetical protein